MLRLSIIRRGGSIQAFGRNVAVKLLLEKAARIEPNEMQSGKPSVDSSTAGVKERTGPDSIALPVETYAHPGADPTWMDGLEASTIAQPLPSFEWSELPHSGQRMP
jgi:hypothetical protein